APSRHEVPSAKTTAGTVIAITAIPARVAPSRMRPPARIRLLAANPSRARSAHAITWATAPRPAAQPGVPSCTPTTAAAASIAARATTGTLAIPASIDVPASAAGATGRSEKQAGSSGSDRVDANGAKKKPAATTEPRIESATPADSAGAPRSASTASTSAVVAATVPMRASVDATGRDLKALVN